MYSSQPSYHYFSMQYSAIQKTVLRHDRLWSIAGISNRLSRMNEVDMPAIAERHGGQAIVAGGGKFTARFIRREDAQNALDECICLVTTTLPTLEFQYSGIEEGLSFKDLVNEEGRNRLLVQLDEKKRTFRGYGVSFNPHLMLCQECGEFPVQEKEPGENGHKEVCRICHAAFQESRSLFDSRKAADTTLRRIYHGYLGAIPEALDKQPVADFKELFSEGKERQRMAVWFSDLNNMNDKVPVWLKQDENKVLDTFHRFRETVVEIIVRALKTTFGELRGDFLPFRLVVAGGDDLCLVMAEKYILPFALNHSKALNGICEKLDKNHPLHVEWLRANGFKKDTEPKPFGFGASFVVTSIHTPFSRIHRLGEELMSEAKQKTGRQGNSINWRIMAEEESVTEQRFRFERPLFIETADQERHAPRHLSFENYLALMHKSDYQKISNSHRQQIIAIMQQHENPWEVERQLKLLNAGEAEKSFSKILLDKKFRDPQGQLSCARIATLFELQTIGHKDEVNQ